MRWDSIQFYVVLLLRGLCRIFVCTKQPQGPPNISTQIYKNIYKFDSATFYAHSEIETANWRCNYNKIHDQVYACTYLRHFAPSEPYQE